MYAVDLQDRGHRQHPGERYWRRHFHPSVEKLRIAQLRDGSPYSRIRTCTPVAVLAVLWLWVTHWSMWSSPRQLLEQSITIRYLLLACAVVGLWNLCLGLSVYSRRSARRDVLAELHRLWVASFACSLPFVAESWTRVQHRQSVFLSSITAAGLLAASLLLLLGFLLGASMSRRLRRSRVAVIVGTGRRAAVLRARLQSQYSPYTLYGCIDDEYMGRNAPADAYLGEISELEGLLKAHRIEIVLIGLPMRSKYNEIERVIHICEKVGVESRYMQDVFEASRPLAPIHRPTQDRFTASPAFRPDLRRCLKQASDLFGASALLVLFSPIMLGVAVAVRLTSAGPILFVQHRYAMHRRRFRMFKFRSMVVDAEGRQADLEERNEAQGPVFKLKSDPRVTRIGSLLRRASIDELPQLFNVLRGEMSLVGPRPLPLRDVSRFEEAWLLRRFSVRAGLTCLWQISGRSNTPFDHWIKQNLTYIDHWSIALDLEILLLTIPAVLRGSGAV